MDMLKLAKLLEGKHTIETIARELNIKKNSAINLVSKLRKSGFLKTKGGGKQKRIYTIKPFFNVETKKNMFSILNKYAKNKIISKFKHNVYGKYSIEKALVDLIKLNDFRILLESLLLFNHIKNWTLLHKYAKKNKLETILGALYDVAKKTVKIRKMPNNIYRSLLKKRTKKKIYLFPKLKKDKKDKNLKEIEEKWNVQIPFSKKDLEELK